MADTPTQATGQEPATDVAAGAQGPATPQVGNGAGTVTPQAGNSDRGTPSHTPDMSLEAALDALEKTRAEAARYRKRAQEYDDLLKQQEDAKLSETERLQKQLAEAQRERELLTQASQERVMRSEVRATARDLGLKPELALRLIDLAAVSFDEAGDPTNIHELLTQAIADYGISVAPVTPASASAPTTPTPSAASGAAPQPGRAAPQAPQTGATNPPRSGQVNGPAGRFARDEIPNLTDPRLWKRG